MKTLYVFQFQNGSAKRGMVKRMRLIDANALKYKAREIIPNYHASVVMNLFDLIDNLADNMPTIEALQGRKAGEWIPVSEGLPEEDTDVLISYRYKEGEGDTSHVYIDITSYGDMYFGGRKVKGAKHWRQPFEYFTSNYEVIAWMPLPEPWKGEEDE